MLRFRFGKNRKIEQARETFSLQSVVEDVQTSQLRSSTFRRTSRLVFLTVLTLIGFYVLAGSGIRTAGVPTHAALSHATIISSAPTQQSHQVPMLAGAGESIPQASTVPAFCAPFDVNCWLGQAAQWVAQNIFNVLQPLIDAINQNSLNFITQTPPAGTYQKVLSTYL